MSDLAIPEPSNQLKRFTDIENKPLRKGTAVAKGFVIFEDNWITDFNDLLEDNEGNQYAVIEFHSVKNMKGEKITLVRLDRPVAEGTILYVVYRIFND